MKVYTVTINGVPQKTTFQSLLTACKQFQQSATTIYRNKGIGTNGVVIIKTELIKYKSRGKATPQNLRRKY